MKTPIAAASLSEVRLTRPHGMALPDARLCTIGIGANLGERRLAIERAIRELHKLSEDRWLRVSPLYETAALVPLGAPEAWRAPYLNGVAEIRWRGTPTALLSELKRIEHLAGREPSAERWSPRPLDLDILLFGDERVDGPQLTIPHPELAKRSFVLDPLKDLEPDFLEASRSRPEHAPLWMAILNLTPDSFSDGGQLDTPAQALSHAIELAKNGAHLLDLGAESTRPGAHVLTPDEEWGRLQPALSLIATHFAGRFTRPLISVDTVRAETARRALVEGADWINDVSGGADPQMASVVARAGCKYVLTHSLSVPAGGARLPDGRDPILEVVRWAKEKIADLGHAGVGRKQIVFDPGIGFGKSAAQNFELIRRVRELRTLAVPLLIGHSRKSFLASGLPAAERDPESLAVSLALIENGIDVLRVHDAKSHIRAAHCFRDSFAR